MRFYRKQCPTIVCFLAYLSALGVGTDAHADWAWKSARQEPAETSHLRDLLQSHETATSQILRVEIWDSPIEKDAPKARLDALYDTELETPDMTLTLILVLKSAQSFRISAIAARAGIALDPYFEDKGHTQAIEPCLRTPDLDGIGPLAVCVRQALTVLKSPLLTDGPSDSIVDALGTIETSSSSWVWILWTAAGSLALLFFLITTREEWLITASGTHHPKVVAALARFETALARKGHTHGRATVAVSRRSSKIGFRILDHLRAAFQSRGGEKDFFLQIHINLKRRSACLSANPVATHFFAPDLLKKIAATLCQDLHATHFENALVLCVETLAQHLKTDA